MSRYKLSGWPFLFLLVAAAISCNFNPPAGGRPSGSGMQATVQTLEQFIAGTATASAGMRSGSGAAIQDAQIQATEAALSLAETQAAQSALSQEVRSATAAAFEPILSELPHFGVEPAGGHPGWLHPPLTLELDSYHSYDYANQFLGIVAADFVVSADIAWNTQYGGSGCGFVLRSDGNKAALNQYLVIATRGASGHVVFATMANGEVVTGKDIYAYGLDPVFDWKNDATNRLTVVGKGNSFNIYTNETLIGEVNPSDPPPQPRIPPEPQEPADKKDAIAMAEYAKKKVEYQTVVAKIRADYSARVRAYQEADTTFERGFVAMVALSESGHTICHFNNAWLWLIDN